MSEEAFGLSNQKCSVVSVGLELSRDLRDAIPLKRRHNSPIKNRNSTRSKTEKPHSTDFLRGNLNMVPIIKLEVLFVALELTRK